GVAFALALSATGGSGIEGLRRFALIAQGSDSSVERLTVWRDAVGLPLSDPLRTGVGFGPETQAAVFERAEATVRLGQNQQWDRAHNLLLDAFLSGGVVVVFALVALIGVSIVGTWRIRSRVGPEERWLAAAVLGAVVGHVVE